MQEKQEKHDLSSSAFVELTRKITEIDTKLVESNTKVAEALQQLTLAIKENEFNNKSLKDYVQQKMDYISEKQVIFSKSYDELKGRVSNLETKVVEMDKQLYHTSDAVSKANALWFKIVGGIVGSGIIGAVTMYFTSGGKT